jgi:hypothetical protein
MKLPLRSTQQGQRLLLLTPDMTGHLTKLAHLDVKEGHTYWLPIPAAQQMVFIHDTQQQRVTAQST